MFYRILIAASAIIAAGVTASGQTEKPPGSGGQPGTSTQSPTTSQPSQPVQRKDIYWIGPKKPDPKKPAKPGTSGQLLQPGAPFHVVTAIPNASLARVADRRTPTISDVGQAPWSNARAPSQAIDEGHVVLAQAPVQGPRNNFFVIQFKSGVSAAQRDALLRRFGLVIRKSNESYNIYVVEQPNGSPPPPGASLNDVFNPPIVRQLRAQSIVQNVTVDSSSSARTIPKSSSLNVKDVRGITHQWDWKIYTAAAPNPSELAAAPPPQTLDGNWGHKALRLPAVWTIINRYRAAKLNAYQPRVAIIDTGFEEHENLRTMNLLPTFNSIGVPGLSAAKGESNDPCRRSHGNHVAGIAGAVHGEGIGIDGAIPGAKMDAVPVSDNLMRDDAVVGDLHDTLLARSAFFSEVLFATMLYIDKARGTNNELRVVNISMDLNVGEFVQLNFPLADIKKAIKETLRSQAEMLMLSALKHEKDVLIVTAAGNDSSTLDKPLEAKWASSVVWLAKAERNEIYSNAKRPKNLLVVEAVDRNGQRADFSNIGGQISAPGVDILSTLKKSDGRYGLCDGTSMAAPYAAAVATLLFELAPERTPEQIIDIMVRSATPKTSGAIGAPRLDALEAVLALSPFKDYRNENLVRLTDLNGDGKVDILDMKEFARRLALISENRTNGTAFTEDLNEDKATDANECSFPLIDLNGSGIASLTHRDGRRIFGEHRNDLEVMQLAWTDKTKDTATAIRETGLDAAILAADKVNPKISPQACR